VCIELPVFILYNMSSFQVFAPGTAYIDEVGESAQDSWGLIMRLQSIYAEAILSLELFQKASIDLVEYMRARAAGHPISTPRILMMQAPFVHARSFIYSLELLSLENQAYAT